ncbi:MAG: DMT family transporter, partial [Bacteroidota bacterium]
MDKKEEIIDSKSWLTLIFLSIIWGSSFILIKKGLIAFDPSQMAALRITISGLAFIPFMVLYLKKVDWSKFKYLLLVGLTGSGVPAFLYAIAETRIDSNIAGILNSLTPLFTLVFGIIIYKLESKWAKMWGVLLGFIGALIIIIFGQEVGSESFTHLWYALLIVLATMMYA